MFHARRTRDGIMGGTYIVTYRLCTELGKTLQLWIERDVDVVETPIGTSTKTLKPSIYFAAPQYARKLTKTLVPGSEADISFWNCGKPGHRHAKCRLHIRSAVIAARKAKFFENKMIKAASAFHTNWFKDCKN